MPSKARLANTTQVGRLPHAAVAALDAAAHARGMTRIALLLRLLDRAGIWPPPAQEDAP